jgi:PhnB protein
MNPPGFHTVTPSLTVRDGAAALDFYARAFGVIEHYRLPEPSGKVMHSEFQIGDSRMMLSDEYPEFGAVAPEMGKGGLFMIYVEDCEAALARAIEAGATLLEPATDQFWGDRTARVADPFGYRWTLAQHVREVTPEEIVKGAAEWAAQAGKTEV